MALYTIDVWERERWILITQEEDVTRIRFENEQDADVTVIFPLGAPPDIPNQFIVGGNSYVEYIVRKEVPNGKYPFECSSGGSSTGNGGIEIDR